MVGVGPDRSGGTSSSAARWRGPSIPPLSHWRALEDSLGTPTGASSSASLSTRRGGRVGKKAKGTVHGCERSRRTAMSSSPPPQLIHPSTGLQGWTHLRWRLWGLHTRSLGSTGLHPMRLRFQRLRHTRLLYQVLRPRRLPPQRLRPDGVVVLSWQMSS